MEGWKGAYKTEACVEVGGRCRAPQTFNLSICFVPKFNPKTQTLLPRLSLAYVDAALDIKSAILRNKIQKQLNKDKHEFKIVQRLKCIGLYSEKKLTRVQPSHKTRNQLKVLKYSR